MLFSRVFLTLSLIVAASIVSFERRGAAAEEQPASFMFAQDDEPAWMRRILDKLQRSKGSAAKLVNRQLFHDMGRRPTFLALIWFQGDEHIFELYSVKVHSPIDVRLHFLREVKSWYLAMAQPTGLDVFGDGVPAIFLTYSEGGNMLINEGTRIFRLTGSSVEITPIPDGTMIYTPRERDEDGPDLWVGDWRWGWYFLGCGGCGTFIYMPLIWEKDRYVAACDRWRGDYDDKVEINRRYLTEHPDIPLMGFFFINIDSVLNLAEAGRVDEAQRLLATTFEEARRRPAPSDQVNELLGGSLEGEIERIQTDIGPVLDAAAKAEGYACPLLAYGDEEFEAALRKLERNFSGD
jgi:hypothetical protein